MMSLNSVKNIILVMSGKGGVGKSTIAVRLAFGLSQQGKNTGLLDIDLHGPSVVSMTGIENQPIQTNQDHHMIPIQKNEYLHIVSIASLLDHPDSPVIWRGPMKMGVIEQFIKEVAWPSLDYLIVDCPPGTGDEVLSIIQLLQQGSQIVNLSTIIVSTPQKIAYLDVRKSIQFAKKMNVAILGLIENMSSIICPHCNQSILMLDTSETERASKDFQIDILARIPWDQKVLLEGDQGLSFDKKSKLNPGETAIEEMINKVINKTS
jgi:ATP-binding protein involved in chromosome partitioning